jgi:hypothetical protein
VLNLRMRVWAIGVVSRVSGAGAQEPVAGV